MHWIKLNETWWVDIDKAYSITVWKGTGEINLKFEGVPEPIIITKRGWEEEYDRILNEVMEVVQARSSKENKRMLRLEGEKNV
jgi:hypothetical protein